MMKSYHRHATSSHPSSHIHSSSRDHFIQPPSLIDRSLNYLDRKLPSPPSSSDDETYNYGLPRPSLSSSRKSHHHHNALRLRLSQWRWRHLFTLPVLLTLTWFVVLYWGERQVFVSSIRACNWSQWESWPADATPHHVILVADPQLVDPHTYPGRPWPLSSLTVRHTDLYLRRSFDGLTRLLCPDTVVFLGDLFDGGREWATDKSRSPESRWQKYGKAYWMKEYVRWGRIFVRPWSRAAAAATTAAGREGRQKRGRGRGRKFIAALPGNHDLGFASGIQVPVRKRFHAFFGEGNRVDIVGNHTFVSVDTVSLSAMDQEGTDEELWRPTRDFLDELQTIRKRAMVNELISQDPKTYQRIKYPHRPGLTARDLEGVQTQRRTQQDQLALPTLPTILLSHIPLYRAPETSCGVDREHRNPDSILIHKGYQYQNVLTPQISELLVDKLTNLSSSSSSSGTTKETPPTTTLRVFSGDDHDYCSVTHTSYGHHHHTIPEITVKSISWAMGIRKPGFEMVSLWNPLFPQTRTQDQAVSAAQQQQQDTVQTHLCLLPDQLRIFLRVYAPLLVCSVLAVLLRSCWRVRATAAAAVAARLPTTTTTTTRASLVGGGDLRPRHRLFGRDGPLRDAGSTLAYVALAVAAWYVWLWRL
ncbi:MAG: hypothetical protein M1816_006001 [Peltula sp. TS41687]|nr:MAG: hypothetical protein M1816_006001 [Peltula sp. TS41687]